MTVGSAPPLSTSPPMPQAASEGATLKSHVPSPAQRKRCMDRRQIYSRICLLLTWAIWVGRLVGFHRSDYSYMSIIGEFDAAVPQTHSQAVPRLPAHPARPLNIVIFYPDDWRHDDLGDVKPSYVHTPFLTQLASRGIRFALNAVTTSICWISRATLYTGQYLSRHASDFLVFPRFALPTPWRSSWPYLLQRYGNYYVGHVGKWQYMHVYDGYQKYQDLFNYTRQFQEYHWDEKTGERNTFIWITSLFGITDVYSNWTTSKSMSNKYCFKGVKTRSLVLNGDTQESGITLYGHFALTLLEARKVRRNARGAQFGLLAQSF